MQFEIRRDTYAYKCERIYDATIGSPIRLPVRIGSSLKEFQVRTIKIECRRPREHSPWYVFGIHTVGPVLKKNGEPGLVDRFEYWGVDPATWPEWILPAANEFLAELERERTAVVKEHH